MKNLQGRGKEFLGLSRQEYAVLLTLDQLKRASVSKISQKAKLPRTTTAFLLNKLKTRQLATRVQVLNHYEWAPVSSEKIAAQLMEIATSFEINSGLVGNIISPELSIRAFAGAEPLKEAYKLMLSAGVERIYAIQGHHSAAAQIEQFSNEYISKLHKEFRKKGVIMEVLLGEDTLSLLETMSKDELLSHLDRRVILYLIPNEYMEFDIDILLIKDMVAFINLRSETVTLFTNDAITDSLKKLFDRLKNQSTKIDLNEHIRRLVEKRKKTS